LALIDSQDDAVCLSRMKH